MSRTAIIRAGDASEVERLRPELLELTGDPLDIAREEARRAGYEEGLRLAAEEAAQRRTIFEEMFVGRLADAMSFLENAALFVRAQLSDELDRLAKSATELALEIVEAVLQHEIALSANPGADAIARALALVPASTPAVARCNPADVELLGEISHPLLSFVADPSVGRGGCVLDTGVTLVDARIEAAVARVKELLDRAGGPDV